MSSKHSAEFKAKVALEAVSEQNKILSEVADKYDVSLEEVTSWTEELRSKASNVFDGAATSIEHAHGSKVEDYNIESDDSEFIYAVSHGVEEENLDYKNIYVWSGLGIAIVTIIVVALIYYAQFSFSNAQRNALNTSSYLEITKLKADQTEHINTYGVVDLEAGIYRIPIEQAISNIAID